VLARGDEHVDRPQHVHLRVGGGIGHGAAHVDLRGQVEYELRPHVGEDSRHTAGVTYVELVQLRAGRERVREVLAPAAGEVVNHRDAIASGDERVDQVRSDEAGAAGDHAVHLRPDDR